MTEEHSYLEGTRKGKALILIGGLIICAFIGVGFLIFYDPEEERLEGFFREHLGEEWTSRSTVEFSDSRVGMESGYLLVEGRTEYSSSRKFEEVLEANGFSVVDEMPLELAENMQEELGYRPTSEDQVALAVFQFNQARVGKIDLPMYLVYWEADGHVAWAIRTTPALLQNEVTIRKPKE